MGFLIFYASAAICYFLVDHFASRRRTHLQLTKACPSPQVSETDIVIPGKNLDLTVDDLHRILSKRFTFYAHLNAEMQKRFLQRIIMFMHKKTFIIKDDEGFREMPLLISAAAIQLTFGLKDYLLPFYTYIRIYPEEYFGGNSFKILAGNVQGNVITVAWNHLLEGIENAADGTNVGLHEMSHALYFQKLVVEENFSKAFTKKYNSLLAECRTAFEDEMKGRIDLYSEYATKDMQEFWAESVELFFEKPAELREHYPQVFNAVMLLLNQNPLNTESPVLKS